MSADWWEYDLWEPAPAENWMGGTKAVHPHEADPHVDLGCGTVKKGRIGIDRHAAPGVNVLADLDPIHVSRIPRGPNEDAHPHQWGSSAARLPFPDSSIRSVISHHFFEHVGGGFVLLVDEIWRILEPGGILRAITPLFPSRAAVEDPDHCRYFMCGENHCTWDAFCGENHPGGHWHEGFSVPYTKARFTIVDRSFTPPVPPEQAWGETDVRELRVSLQANK